MAGYRVIVKFIIIIIIIIIIITEAHTLLLRNLSFFGLMLS